MAFIKFSFLFLVLVSSAFAQTRFSSKSCLDATYKMKMVQKGPLFGLLKQEFVIDKKNCIVRISHKKYLPKEWIVDVCREPVHIKVTSATGVDVAKKESECIHQDKSKDTSDFCSQYFDMMDVIQDDGLIFAEGDRDNLNSDHGKTFCTYLLMKKYLNDSVVFSRYTEVPDIFSEKAKEVTPAPVVPSAPVDPKKENQEAKLTTPPEVPVKTTLDATKSVL
ncbi:hypothetical protein [Peredibacter starrii]|uniref:Uncharacterized protein n=1 Tax=Peredibacter starrii TaxID=28202 RepID=A0AAX4HRP8_9BACT|nr:hypothetical protein [Peredibacter starrii]WPU65969.1 hypothetical protein SOO65_04350 [Peredibacter starrii]